MGTTEIIIIAVILVLLFGASRIKSLARGLGESTKEIKKVKRELEEGAEEVKDATKR